MCIDKPMSSAGKSHGDSTLEDCDIGQGSCDLDGSGDGGGDNGWWW